MKTARQHIVHGAVLGDRYRVLDPLGQGGMAYVYLALDQESKRQVALKLMRDELIDDPEFVRRFATEARAAASLDHPNIVHVLDYGQDRNVRYIVQEYVEGRTLKEMIQQEGALDWELAVPLMIQMTLALEHAHRHGIIHRDMKPQNVLVTADMVAKVTDFGIARASHANTITLTGGVAFGSVHYFSPEQARGGNVTERSDLYSLGIMLYEMLTGELPFDGESSVAVAIKQLQEMPLRPSSLRTGLPRSLDDIIFKAIQKNPDCRYQSAAEFVHELDAFMVEPDGMYGVIQSASGRWEGGTSALGVEKNDSNFSKIKELDHAIKSRKRSGRREVAVSLLLVAAVVLGLSFVFYSLYKKFAQEQVAPVKQIEAANYIGRLLDDVLPEIEKIYGQDNIEIDRQQRDSVEEGRIYDQKPDFGVLQKEGEQKIKLFVATAKSGQTMPRVLDLLEDAAKEKLKAMGISAIVRTEYSETAVKGRVLRQEPAEGTILNASHTVTIYVARSSEKVRVPDVEGMSWKEADALAKANDLTLTGVQISKESEANSHIPENERYIVRQLVKAESEVRAGSALRVEYGSREDMEEFKKSNASFVMMNLVNMDFDQAKQWLNMNWPANDKSTVLFIFQGGVNQNDRGLVVLSQSVQAGMLFNPAESKLTLVVGYASTNPYYPPGYQKPGNP